MSVDDPPNAHGLRRADFREPARRALRQACGFGCVICGSALYEYAHVDPPFKDARRHDIERMALLCSSHHDALDKWHRVSKREVMEHRANPAAKRDGFARDLLSGSVDEFILTIGDIFFCDCHHVLRIDGSDILRIDRPEVSGGPYRVSGIFCDADGALVANIVENEVTYRSATWDVELEGPKMTLRSAPGKISLVLITIPDKGLRIERMDMSWCGVRVVANDERLVVSGLTDTTVSLSHGTIFQDCEHCIRVSAGVVTLGDTPVGGDTRILGGGFIGRPPRR
jgi:hypothetical protein